MELFTNKEKCWPDVAEPFCGCCRSGLSEFCTSFGFILSLVTEPWLSCIILSLCKCVALSSWAVHSLIHMTTVCVDGGVWILTLLSGSVLVQLLFNKCPLLSAVKQQNMKRQQYASTSQLFKFNVPPPLLTQLGLGTECPVRAKVKWPRELNVLQLKKTNANRKSTSKLREHLHQFDNTCAANTHNQIQKCTANTHSATKFKTALRAAQTTMEMF